MKHKSAERIQFDIACMRLAYRLRPVPLNTRRRTGLMPRIHPLLLILIYTISGFISLAIIAAFFNATR